MTPDRCLCGELIDGEPEDPAIRKPCPRCGSKVRSLGISARLQGTGSAAVQTSLIAYAETLLAKSQTINFERRVQHSDGRCSWHVRLPRSGRFLALCK
jgi:hypothetical protein